MTAPTAICAKCEHRRKGFGTTKIREGRARKLHFDICAKFPIREGTIDPVSGRQEMDEGTACAAINAEGRCALFEEVHSGSGLVVSWVVVWSSVVAALAALIAWLAGATW